MKFSPLKISLIATAVFGVSVIVYATEKDSPSSGSTFSTTLHNGKIVEVEHYANGMERVSLENMPMHYSVLVRAADDSRTISCVRGDEQGLEGIIEQRHAAPQTQTPVVR